MRFLVLQHIACEHPGIFRKFLAADGITWDAVSLDAGQTIPPLEPYDALWVMGGPMDVWDVEDHPWLIEEKRAIRRWVRELDRPFLGLCLGHQLLADALAGTCGPQRPSEIGILDVALTPEAARDPVFAGLPEEFKVLQWHSVKVAQPPDGAIVLARSDVCGCQAMRAGNVHGACNITSRLNRTRSRNGAKCRPMPRLWSARMALGLSTEWRRLLPRTCDASRKMPKRFTAILCSRCEARPA